MSDAALSISLIAEHDDLNALFQKHQEALVERDMPLAAEMLAQFRTELQEHMQMEERELFPIYERAETPPGGSIRQLLSEHQLIMTLLGEIETRFRRLSGRPAAPDLIELLDEEGRLKRVLEHHDLRERSTLYPAIDSATTPSERDTLQSRRFDADSRGEV